MKHNISEPNPTPTNSLYDKYNDQDNFSFQQTLLIGVSRTFALTIPQLPDRLRYVISNAYLLCRIVDTVEDEPNLSASQKQEYCNWFSDIVKNFTNVEDFSRALAPLLSESTIPMEHELIHMMPRVMEITREFDENEKQALARCVEIMSEGMAFFQQQDVSVGLKDMKMMDKYCYYVAGVVGEMLTELFCLHIPEFNERKEEVMKLAVSFGQGLQMTNILKDVWDDAERNVCWLPKDIFKSYGYDLAKLKETGNTINFQHGISQLVGVAHGHLKNAMKYTTLLPSRETGVRKFCLWALWMAIINLDKIQSNLDYTNSQQVKISRNQVKQVIIASNLFAKYDTVLNLLFSFAGRKVPFNTVNE